jgi:hypothetical protein
MESQASEDATREEWHGRVLDLQVERRLRKIESAAARYKARTGSFPKTVHALIVTRDLESMPIEPRGGRYVLTPAGEAYSTATARLRVSGRAGTQSGLIAQ